MNLLAISVRLSQEELEQIETLAGAGYGPEKIAVYLDVPVKDFMKEWRNAQTLVHFHYKRGVLIVDAEVGMKLAQNAREGNITAAQQLAKVRWEQHLNDSKNQIYFNGGVDEI